MELLNGNHGFAVNNAGYAGGLRGTAFTFDGTNDMLVVSNAPSLQLQDLTIEAWVKRTSSTVASFGSGNVGVIFGYGTGGYIFYMDGSGALHFGRLGDPFIAISTITVSDTNYHHVAVTRTGADIAFYIDGIAETAAPYNPVFDFTTDAAIGARIENLDNSFFGRIDELSIYSRALSGVEVQAVHLAGSDGKCSSIPPQFITQPTNATVEVGGSAAFSVQTFGTLPLSYQWLFNGNTLPGATNASLTLYNVSPAMGGDYAVLVTNEYGSALSATAVLSVMPAPQCTSWPTGIVSWWRAESDAYDHFGINNGYPIGNTSYAFGRVGLGFMFDGAGDMVLLTNQSSLQLQSFTIETWIRRGSSTVASFGSGGNGVLFGYGNGGYLCYLNGAGSLFFAKQGQAAVVSAWQIADTNLHHVAITKSNTVISFYLDGTNISSTTYNQTFVFNTPLGIGGRPDNLDNSFLGTIDDLAFYNRSLTGAEVQAIHLAGVSGKCVIPLLPKFTLQPTNVTVSAGGVARLAAAFGGTPPFAIQWSQNGASVSGATNASLVISNVQPSQSGSYRIAVANAFGVDQSSNAVLNVVVVSAFGNGQALTNSSHAFNGNVTIQLLNAYAGGLTFYTLDGSQPTFGSTQYTGPFIVSSNVILRALGYRADFFESGELGPIAILLPPSYPLTLSSGGGGSVSVNPPVGPYLSNTVVTLTATPAAGWQFLQWLGDATGNSSVIEVTMNRPKSLQAVFGTTLSTTAAGGGSLLRNPSSGVYPFGANVQLTAIPNAGNQFALWGSAASGNVNPLNFFVTNANPTVSSLFVAVSGGQSALTVVPVGQGQVTVNPRANAYVTGAQVNISTTPATGQTFLGWSGDASGNQNPLAVTMNQSKVIYANFTVKPSLTGKATPEGFQVTLTGDYVGFYQMESSTNLTGWSALMSLTNTSGTFQFTDPAATNLIRRYYRAYKFP